VVAIDRMQTEEFLRTGNKPERSEIVSRAIKQLSESGLAGRRDSRPGRGLG